MSLPIIEMRVSTRGTKGLKLWLYRFLPNVEVVSPKALKEEIREELREAAGKIRLGLDLQGGTSFRVKMDTSAITNKQDSTAALSQAVEVLRKRVDRFGVAEPRISRVHHAKS